MKNLHQIREISTLSFNERVLQEAEDARNPLMERLRFLGIFSSNMDEFFKVRVASIHRRIELGKKGMAEVIEVVSRKAQELEERFQAAYADITDALSREGVRILTEEDVDDQPPELGAWLREYFSDEVLPHLVPIILRKGMPFPQLTDGALYFGVKMWGEHVRYAILEIPPQLARFVQLPNGDIMYIDDVIRYMLHEVFYIFQYSQVGAYEFKISRDAELDIDNDFSEGYVRKMERVLRQRKGGRPVRFVYDASIPSGLRDILLRELKAGKDDTLIAGGRYHNMRDLMRFPNHRADLSFEAQEPAKHPILSDNRTPMLDIIERQDLLVTYPFQSFDHVVRLLREAAIDPNVTAIKMTLYRVARTSQVVNALVNAARNGKQVTVSIELLARFDEENNIRISERLLEVGATVLYGVPPMKVHSKLMLIARNGTLYAGLSTGNFNETTGHLYVDSCLFTADKRVTGEVAQVFGFLEQASKMRTIAAPKFKHLLVSPFNTRKLFKKYVAREKAKGSDGYIFVKANHLTDDKVINLLMDAADAGVRMDLVIRTTYAMLPHPNIHAVSILDRYLEHQRVYIFGKGADRAVFMSSADLMERNLDWRVEVAFPVYDKKLKREVSGAMAIQIADCFKARILDEVQSNHYKSNGPDGIRAQYATYQYYHNLYQAAYAKRAPANT